MKSNRKIILPISEYQKRFWLEWALDTSNLSYNISVIYKIVGQLDKKRLKRAFFDFFENNDLIHATFSEDGSVQYYDYFNFNQFYLEKPLEKNENVEKLIKELLSKPFDLTKGPLCFACIIEDIKDTYYVVCSAHHVIFDAISAYLYTAWISEVYNNLKYNKSFSKKNDRISYNDCIKQEKTQFNLKDINKAKKYWESLLHDSKLNIDIGRKKKNLDDTSSASIFFNFNEKQVSQLKQYAKLHKTSIFIIFSAAFGILLSKYSGEENFSISYPINMRPKGFGKIIGCFVNNVPFKFNFSKNITFDKMVYELTSQRKATKPHQFYSFTKILHDQRQKRNYLDPDYFNCGIVDTYLNADPLKLDGLTIESIQIPWSEESHYEICLLFDHYSRSPAKIICRLDYQIKSFDKEFIQEFVNAYRILLINCLHEQRPVRQIPIITPTNYHQIINKWNNTEKLIPQIQTLHEIFEEQCKKTPDNIAVIFEDKTLTYKELNQKSNKLARLICWKYEKIKHQKIEKDTLIGVLLDRSLDMIISLLGILKSVGAYVPLDPDYPIERLQYIINDSDLGVVITTNDVLKKTPSIKKNYKNVLLVIDEPENNHILEKQKKTNLKLLYSIKNLAYVIYTSGSTGKPKGTLIEHESIVNRIQWMHQHYGLKTSDRVLQKTSFSFDVSVWEFFWPILHGAQLVIAIPEGQKDPEYLLQAIKKYQISQIHFVPSMLHIFMEYIELLKNRRSYLKSIKNIFCSGEILEINLAKKVLNTLKVNLNNLYGPTEASIDVSFFDCKYLSKLKYDTVPIGKPIYNTKLYILNRDLQLCPIGVVGELYISGKGLARGYLKQQKLTNERFIQNIFIKNDNLHYSRMYKTGDLVKWLPDGNIAFISRTDFQVKIRGFRIELTEIESVINQYPNVLKSAVIAKKIDNTHQIVAYCTTKNKALDLEGIKKFIRKKLPDYMMPNNFLLIDKIPLTESGKVNHNQLLANFKVETTVIPHVEVPLTPIQIWFFKQKFQFISHWNQAFFFYVKKIINITTLKKAFNASVIQNDSLRLRFLVVDRKVTQYYNHSPDSYHVPIHLFKLTQSFNHSKSEIKKIVNSLHKKLDITKGPIMQVALFENNTDKLQLLFVCIHHLVVDLFSWKILIEDLSRFYEQYQSHNKIISKPNPTSYYHWSNMLSHYSVPDAEIKYWQSISKKSSKEKISIINDYSIHNKLLIRQIHFSKSVTEKIIQQYDAEMKSQASAILLSALLLTVDNLLNLKNLLIDVENSSRNNFFLDFDFKQTVGWFTSKYPILLSLTSEGNETQQIINLINKIHVNFLKAESQYLSFGILAYLKENKLLSSLKPQVLFNYIGQLSNLMSTNFFQLTNHYNSGSCIPSANRVDYPLTINSYIIEHKLYVQFESTAKYFSEKTFSEFISYYQFRLNKIAKDFKKINLKIHDEALNTISPVEAEIIEIWKNLFKINTITVHDNFFRLGGDSLLAISFCSRVRKLGLNIKPKMLFLYPTPRDIAKITKNSVLENNSHDISKKTIFQLTPFQYYFFQQELSFQQLNYFTTDIITKLNIKISFRLIQKIASILETKYDTVRLHFKKVNNEQLAIESSRIRRNHIFVANFVLNENQYRDFNDFYIKTTALLRSQFNVTDYPNLIIALFNVNADKSQYLYLAGNHLFYDLYSMNIILQDIYQLFKQHEDKQPLSFPLISSYRVWLNNINSLNCRKDKTLLFKQWRSIAKKSKASPCDFNFKKPLVKNLRIMTEILLDEYSLNKLLTCHYDKKYSFNIESIVLGIFLLSSFNVHKLSSMSLNIVNSGREMDMPFDIEISQLIGNTLAIVPMFFSIKNFSNAFNQKNVLIEFIQSVHAELLSANENPYDFGYLMMQANSEEKKVLSKINQLKTIFVYLGKMRDNYHGMEDLFSLADQPFSTEREADAPLDFYLNVFNALYQKKLILSFVYSEKNYKYETLLKYVEECKKILNLLLND